MDTTIDQHVVMDEALVPHARRLRIGRSNFRLLLDISSKESTLQLVYDVMRLTPFIMAFLVTADVPEIYMQEFWATATVEHKDTKKSNEMYYPRFTKVEHKDTKKSNEMYYPRFTKVIIHHFMSKDPSILRRNKVNWYYFGDDHTFTTIKLYAVATGATPPKPKVSVQKTRSSFDIIVTPPTVAAGPRLSTSAKGKQPTTTFKAKSLSALSEALVEAYESDKIILDTYGDTVTLKRRSDDDADKDEEPFDRSDRGSKRSKEGNELESASAPQEKATRSAGKSTQGSKSQQKLASESATAEEPMQTTFEIEEPSHPEFETGADDQPITPTSVAPLIVSAPTLTPLTIATIYTTQQAPTPPTTVLSTLLQDLPDFGSLFGFDHRLKTLEANFSEFTQTNQFAGAVSSIPGIVPQAVSIQLLSPRQRQQITGKSSGLKTWCLGQYGFKNQESAHDVYSKHRIIAVIELKIFKWHNYKHLDWIASDMYRSNLKRKEAYIAYSNPRGFIYQNKDNQNRLMQINELYKFSDGTLTDVRTALDDRLKGIQMKYLPQSI
nr:hypothetical protein [Tanacetum cinerariifolium]